MRLMIVDDHAPAREMIRRILELPGVVFCECTSGEEALQQVREFKPHWITMDVNMPGLNGFQSTEALRAEHPSARVVIVTSYSEGHYRERSHAAGAVALINKENLMALRIMVTQEMDERRSTPPATV
ncbi:MAG: response regulator transcription factor [Verrucomicrobiota bacterium]